VNNKEIALQLTLKAIENDFAQLRGITNDSYTDEMKNERSLENAKRISDFFNEILKNIESEN